jgi:hypothetical protein
MTSITFEFDRVNSVALPNTIFSSQRVKPAPMFRINQRLAMRKDINHNILIPQVSHMLNTIFTPSTFRTINTIPTVTFPYAISNFSRVAIQISDIQKALSLAKRS